MARLAALGPDRIVSFRHQGQGAVRFWVPKGHIDYIQSFYVLHETFWDLKTVEYFSRLVRNRTVLDIGSNIGNHAIYWSRIAGAARVHAFEPIPETFETLERNIALNDCGNITAHRLALGERSERGTSLSTSDNRMMAQVVADPDGEIQVVALDEMGFSGVDFVKIDVEGHTIGVIKGGLETLRTHKPVVYVELYAHERDACDRMLREIGYREPREFEQSNYLYIHAERPFEGDFPEA